MTTDSPTIQLASRLAGGVWGHLVGDALGVPYEFRSPSSITSVELGAQGSWRVPTGTWSDDGALMLALLDSLLSVGFDPEDQGRRALAWARGGAYTPHEEGRFDIGTTTSRAMDALERGVPALDAGPAGEQAGGNGSLMRILPVALVGRDLPDAALIDRAALASRVTHGHPRAQVACAVHVLIARGLLRGDPPAPVLAAALTAVRAVAADQDGWPDALAELEGWTKRTGSGFVTDAFWSAWDAFAGAASYQDAIERAIRYGHDTDTTAAIAGGLAGIRWGWEGIPVPWRRAIRDHAQVVRLVDRLVGGMRPASGRDVRTSTSSPLRVDRVDLAGVPELDTAPGQLRITFLPGKKTDGWTGPWWRDVDLDAASLRDSGVTALLLLVEDQELAGCRLADLPEALEAAGVTLLRHPIRDPRLPVDDAAYRAAVRDLADRIRAGERVAIACRGGMDRAGMTASCLLVEAGLSPDAAIARVQAARKGTITLSDQQAYVRAWPHADR